MAIKTITMDQAHEYLAKDDNIKLIDVRNIDEFEKGYIPNAINIPISTFMDIEKHFSDKGTPIFVYCHSGKRSARAASGFDKLGYTDITNIGGINDWTHEIIKP